jgi:hypothetical protein
MHLTNEELLWWGMIGIAVRETAGGARSAARAAGELRVSCSMRCNAALCTALPSAPSSQPCQSAYKNARPLWTLPASPTSTYPYMPTTTIAQSIVRNLDGDAPRDAARR